MRITYEIIYTDNNGCIVTDYRIVPYYKRLERWMQKKGITDPKLRVVDIKE